jgi:D-glycero-D-manno-heptose 1,7-bisphosphate phosphatase
MDSGRKAFFFDRDGTLMIDRGYMRTGEDVQLFPDAISTLTELRRRGFLLIVVSNQSGIGRGLITEAEAQAVSDRFSSLLSEHGVILDAVHWCPHLPEEACQCRKPEPGMLRRAATDLGIDLGQSYMVGDRHTDCEAGERVGCIPVLITGDDATEKVPDGWKTIRNLSELLELI